MSICIFGDSIVWGAKDYKNGGWVTLLKNHLKEKDLLNVYNLGVSGDNTDDLLERFENECKARAPEIIIFAIGENDSQYIKSKDNPRVSLDKFQENLNKLLNRARKFTKKIVFVGLTEVDESKVMPIPWSPEKYYDNENVNKYNSKIKNFCLDNNVLFLDILNLLNNEELDDGIHPNSKGHEKIFNKVKDFMLKTYFKT